MRIIKALPRQTIWDIAIQEYGSVMGASFIVKDNNLNGYTTTIVPGQVLKINNAPIDAANVRYYRERNIKPVSQSANDFLVPDFNPEDFN